MADVGFVSGIQDEPRAAKPKKKAKQKRRRVRARPVLPGQTVKITIRCRDGELLMAIKKNPELARQIFGYLLGVALQRYGLLFHGGSQQCSHHHLDVTDSKGKRPSFKRFLHGFLARAFNSIHGRSGSFFERSGSWDTEWDSDEEMFDLVYTDTNSVKHGQVEDSEDWPYFTSAGWKFGETRTFERPDIPFFDLGETDWPDSVSITRVRPSTLAHLTDEEASSLLEARVREQEATLLAKHRAEGRPIRGVQKVRADSWKKSRGRALRAKTKASRVASSCRWKKAAMEQRDRVWENEYGLAYEDLLAGKRNVEFPYGTWWMRVHAGVCVVPPPD